ncbi:MAG TPA: hypothetical protein VD994_12970 [Prosthecobacter sp.]|nr:hypothetical protein [Prosthecobacter sp.]
MLHFVKRKRVLRGPERLLGRRVPIEIAPHCAEEGAVPVIVAVMEETPVEQPAEKPKPRGKPFQPKPK